MASKAKAAAPAKAAGGAAAPKGAAGKKAKAPHVKQTVPQWKASRKHLFPARPRLIETGGRRKVRDLTHFTKWPMYVRLQRQRAILKQRIRVPAAINQFSVTISKDQAASLFSLLANYRPESDFQKAQRRKAAGAADVKGAKTEATKPQFIKYGLNHVTTLIESKKAKLVVIAHDVDPIELVVWLPTLCRKMGVPFCIVKGKARLGYLVHKKSASVLAVTSVKKADEPKLQQLQDAFGAMYSAPLRQSGGNKMSHKAQEAQKKRQAIQAASAAKKAASAKPAAAKPAKGAAAPAAAAK